MKSKYDKLLEYIDRLENKINEQANFFDEKDKKILDETHKEIYLIYKDIGKLTERVYELETTMTLII